MSGEVRAKILYLQGVAEFTFIKAPTEKPLSEALGQKPCGNVLYVQPPGMSMQRLVCTRAVHERGERHVSHGSVRRRVLAVAAWIEESYAEINRAVGAEP